MANVVDQEVSALSAATGQNKPLPELRQAFFSGILDGSIGIGGGYHQGRLC